VATITLPSSEIIDRKTFHVVCQRVFGFPEYYGHNWNAWIDCMSCLDDPEEGMSSVVLKAGELLLVTIPDAEDLMKRAPEVVSSLIECTAIVNRRFLERGGSPLIGLMPA
jgi:barstar (barnase inhibitor)